jgi:hypothetical protein
MWVFRKLAEIDCTSVREVRIGPRDSSMCVGLAFGKNVAGQKRVCNIRDEQNTTMHPFVMFTILDTNRTAEETCVHAGKQVLRQFLGLHVTCLCIRAAVCCRIDRDPALVSSRPPQL